MGLLRLLLLIGVIWVVVTLVRRHLVAKGAETRRVREVRTVRCAYCGVHVPEPEAVRRQGHDYCSAEHSNLGASGD